MYQNLLVLNKNTLKSKVEKVIRIVYRNHIPYPMLFLKENDMVSMRLSIKVGNHGSLLGTNIDIFVDNSSYAIK